MLNIEIILTEGHFKYMQITNKHIMNREGFTIVELLIVIVVIAILAAITIVAYSGITARAKTSTATAAAEAVTKKAEAYNVDSTNGGYPATFAALTGAASTTSYYLNGVALTSTLLSTGPSNPSTINFFLCGTSGTTTAPTSYSGITNITGDNIGYWNYSTNSIAYDPAGTVSGTVGTFPIACFISTT